MVLTLQLKGPFKYYVSTLGGVGGPTQIADIADALRGGGGSGAGMLM